MSQTNGKGFFIWQIRLGTPINFREKQNPQERKNMNGEEAYKKILDLASNSRNAN